MQLSVAVMAHPKRKKFVDDLMPNLPGAEVVWDRCNNRWDTGRRAMLAFDSEADWHLVVQDDAVLCDAFLPGVARALSSVPVEFPVSFYTGKTRPYGQHVKKAVEGARQQGQHWFAMRGPLWGVAVALPVSVIEQMVAECDGVPIPNYDMRMSEWFHNRGVKCWYSQPSLVDHRVGPDNPSLVPGRGSGLGRTAHRFLEDSPLEIDWDTGAHVPGDPSELWFEGNVCGRCMQEFSTLPEVVQHVAAKHGLGRVDFLASTSYHARQLVELRAGLAEALKGTLYVVGAEVSAKVHEPHRRLLRKNAARKIGDGPFTIVGAARDLKYIGRRSGWSLVDGQAN